MKRNVLIAAATILSALLAAPLARAEERSAADAEAERERSSTAAAPEKETTLHIEPLALIPLGAIAETTGPGIGATVGFDHRLVPSFSLTGRVGYIGGLDKEKALGPMKLTSSVSEVPVFAGVKYFFAGQPKGLYYAQELGIVFTTVAEETKTDDPTLASVNRKGSDTSVLFGGNLGVGYRIGDVDLGASLFTVRYDKADKTSGLMARLSYSFAAF